MSTLIVLPELTKTEHIFESAGCRTGHTFDLEIRVGEKR